MASKSSIFWLSFSGKLVAAAFVAVCTLLGFGPDRWVDFVVNGLPQWITPNRARGLFMSLAALALFAFLWFWQKSRERNYAVVHENIAVRVSIVALCEWAKQQGWQFTGEGSQHIFDFVRTLRDAGSTESVQFWGREKQYTNSMTRDKPLVKIPAEYWRTFQLDGISLLDISPKNGGAHGCATDNLLTSTVSEGNLTQRQLYRDIHLDRQSAVRWLETEGLIRRGEFKSKDSQFDGLDKLSYLKEPETDLTTAIFMMVHNSDWGHQEFGGLELSSFQNDIREAMQKAAIEVRQAAIDGNLTVRGTTPGTSNQKQIATGDWKYAVLNVQPCTHRAWKIVATPNDGNWNRDNRAWRYEDLAVDSHEFEELWPATSST